MKSLISGIIIFIFGYFLICFGSVVLGNDSSDNTGIAIVLSVLYLSAIVGVATITILDEIRNNKK